MTDFLRPNNIQNDSVKTEHPLDVHAAEGAAERSAHTPQPHQRFERVPVPKASQVYPQKIDTQNLNGVKKGKRISSLFTKYYFPLFIMLISVVCVGGYLLLDPLFNQFKITNQTISVRREEYGDAQAYLESIQRSIAAAKSIPEDILKKVDAALPRDVDEPRLLATMEAFGKKTGISVDSVQFSTQSATRDPSAPVSTLAVAPIHISLDVISPSYTAARTFLQEVEQSIPLLDVSRISVSGDKTTGEFTYQLSMETYSIEKAKDVLIQPTTAATPADMPQNDMTAGTNGALPE